MAAWFAAFDLSSPRFLLSLRVWESSEHDVLANLVSLIPTDASFTPAAAFTADDAPTSLGTF